MAVKMTRRITQETFDECVQGNIDDFEMEPDDMCVSTITTTHARTQVCTHVCMYLSAH